MPIDQTNRRFIITGGPGSGKTTLLEALTPLGYTCAPDSARAIIQKRKAAGLSPRPGLEQFGWEMLQFDIEQYESAGDTDLPMFFDRGIVDSLGYLDQYRQISATEAASYLARYPYNDLVFVAPAWSDIFCNDDERDQTFGESVEVGRTMRKWYEKCGYTLLDLPVASVADRVEFVTYNAKSAVASR